ncbi:MAG: thioredoxin domain-containing protein, partial [Luteibaculum sp.]
MKDQDPQFTNALINEASPYLLQHAHNPVNWLPWGKEAFEKAKAENKLVLVSIGYSSCHWCHVMEHESFEDTVVAKIMNDNFICIKVDREERPDVDEIYMGAVQIMTQQGGWPLNCFTLPDGRPVYGGTYFRKDDWLSVLQQLADMYRQTPSKMEEYASQLTAAIQQEVLIDLPETENKVDPTWIREQVDFLSRSFDKTHGGHSRAPKFPMPVEWNFLLEYGSQHGDQALLDHVHFTLRKMAMGGIYDQVGGGFTRYSVDEKWKVPHFEKMLYDNAQLLELYAKAYRQKAEPLYQEVCEGIYTWLQREMKSEAGGYYAALDADSEGEEGKFYVWTREELEAKLTEKELELATEYFNFNQKGYWEHGNYIPLLDEQSLNLKSESANEIAKLKTKLLGIRGQRIKPGLDDKQISSWNALLVNGLLAAYVSFGEDRYLQAAEETLEFIEQKCWDADSKSLAKYYKQGAKPEKDFLEDYSFWMRALLKAFEVSGEEKYLEQTKQCLDIVEQNFAHKSGFYMDRPKSKSDLLISPTINKTDNVTPSPNAVLALVKYKMSSIFYQENWKENSLGMALKLKDQVANYP